jgi:hypothetical protein
VRIVLGVWTSISGPIEVMRPLVVGSLYNVTALLVKENSGLRASVETDEFFALSLYVLHKSSH